MQAQSGCNTDLILYNPQCNPDSNFFKNVFNCYNDGNGTIRLWVEGDNCDSLNQRYRVQYRLLPNGTPQSWYGCEYFYNCCANPGVDPSFEIYFYANSTYGEALCAIIRLGPFDCDCPIDCSDCAPANVHLVYDSIWCETDTFMVYDPIKMDSIPVADWKCNYAVHVEYEVPRTCTLVTSQYTVVWNNTYYGDSARLQFDFTDSSKLICVTFTYLDDCEYTFCEMVPCNMGNCPDPCSLDPTYGIIDHMDLENCVFDNSTGRDACEFELTLNSFVDRYGNPRVVNNLNFVRWQAGNYYYYTNPTNALINYYNPKFDVPVGFEAYDDEGCFIYPFWFLDLPSPDPFTIRCRYCDPSPRIQVSEENFDYSKSHYELINILSVDGNDKHYRLYSVNGMLISSRINQLAEVENLLGYLPIGMYYVEVRQGDQRIKLKKIVKTH